MLRAATECCRRTFELRRWRAAVVALTLVGGVLTAPECSAADPALPVIQPLSGKSFIPTVGDWEGTADGFPASFELRYDPALRGQPGIPRYGLSQIVIFLPSACPVNASRYRETFIEGNPDQLGAHGSLALAEFGISGRFGAAKAATMASRFALPACRGTLTWHMVPAARRRVDDGTWTARFTGGERERFTVEDGGRVAVGLALPRLLASCNGASGGVNLFIGASGVSRYSSAVVRLKLTFSGRAATGTLDSGDGGCHGGPIRFTASTAS